MSNGATKPLKIYPSSAAFMEGGLVFTKYSSGCLRYLLLRHHGVKEDFDPSHAERGALNEQLFEEGLGSTPFIREKPFCIDVPGCNGAVVSGRIDVVLHPDHPQLRKIQELKSTESSSVLKSVIKDGKVNIQNLAQVVSYMVAEQCENADIVVTYYKRDKKSKVLKKDVERCFKIDLSEDGLIMVDSNSSGFYVANLLKHFRETAKAIKEHRVAGRPYSSSPYDSPCSYCPFRNVCDLYDAGCLDSTDEFIAVSKQVKMSKDK